MIRPSNIPVFRESLYRGGGHQEVWYLEFNTRDGNTALWLRFTLLLSRNDEKQVAEVWAISFQRTSEGIVKIGVKETHPLKAFTTAMGTDGKDGFSIGDCFFSDTATWGCVQHGDHEIRWDLTMRPEHETAFDFIPPVLTGSGLVKNMAVTPFEDLRFSGWSIVDGERREWQDAPGMQGHLAGPKNGHSWAWAHCNTFINSEGEDVDCVVDVLTARARVGANGALPALTTFLVRYDGTEYHCNTLWRAIRTQSLYNAEHWTFRTSCGDRHFCGHIHAEKTEFAGVTYEDTDGAALYCHNSKISSMALEIYRGSTLEKTLIADNTVAYEFVSRKKHPDITFVI